MAFVPATDVIQAELVMDWDGQIVENVLYFLSNIGISESTIEDLLDNLIAWWAAEIAPTMSNELSLVSTKGTDLTSSGSFVLEDFTGLPDVGNVAQASTPNNAAMCIKFLTPNSGRSSRGRNFVPGQVDSNTVGSTEWAPTALATMLLGYLELFNAPFTPDYEWVVVSRISGGVDRVTALVQPITEIGGDVFIDSQRRRLAGRGT